LIAQLQEEGMVLIDKRGMEITDMHTLSVLAGTACHALVSLNNKILAGGVCRQQLIIR
jgi:hypothetical protein